MQQKSNNVPNTQQKLDRSVIPKRPLVGQQDVRKNLCPSIFVDLSFLSNLSFIVCQKFKCSDDALVEAKLEATKRKLHVSYQQAANGM